MREIEDNVSLLTKGWNERIEYKIRVGEEIEGRAKNIHHRGLLKQLRTFDADGDAGPGDGAQRGSPNKSGSRPPGRMQGFLLHDEIMTAAAYYADIIRLEVPGTLGPPLAAIVLGARRLQDARPELVREIAGATRTWVRDARRVLSHEPDRRQVMFQNTVCQCGGALSVARDASTAVVCAGTPQADGCGVRYERGQWLQLLDAQRGSG